MENVTVMFRLDAATLDALKNRARDSGIDIGDLVRQAIHRELILWSGPKHHANLDDHLATG